jgi:hypothetical protein
MPKLLLPENEKDYLFGNVEILSNWNLSFKSFKKNWGSLYPDDVESHISHLLFF